MKLPKPTRKQLAFIVGILLAIVTTTWVSVAIPTSMSDGLEQLEGEQKKVAQEELETYITASTTSIEQIDSIGVFKYRVERVEQSVVPATGVYSRCQAVYKVYISEFTFFGLSTASDYRLGCQRS